MPRQCPQATYVYLGRATRRGDENRERKCADTTGTVLVPSAGHFQRQNITIRFKWKQFYQTAPGNCYGFKLSKC